MSNIIDLINAEFARLGVDTDADPYSGLSVGAAGSNKVRIFDDYEGGFYDPEKVLQVLKSLNKGDTTLDSEAPNCIWQLIHDCAS